MPSYEYVGSDPVEHFWAGRVETGDVVEFDGDPGPLWKASRKKATAGKAPQPTEKPTEHGSDDTSEES